MAGNLRNFRSLLRKYKLISDSSRIPGEFQVISIYCYSADLNFLKALTPPLEDDKKEVLYLYDILLSDGSEKLKCFLALPLGHLVQKNVIKVGIHVQIQKAKLCYLEGEYNDSHIVQYVLLEALKIVEYDAVVLPDLGAIRFTESVNYRETDHVPLVTGRKCYVYPWVPCLPFGEECTDGGNFEYSEDDDTPQNISSLQDLADDWMRLPKPYPTLFVRVLARGMLYYYGFNKNDRPHPFLAKIVIGDVSSTCQCVVFGKTSVPLYYNATPGTILLIENYTIAKPLKLLLPRIRGNAGNLPSLDIEIIIGDTSKIRIVPPDNTVLLMQITLLPIVEFSFGDRASLEFAANESTVDIVGLITNVSLFHRFVYKFGKIHARVYVEVIDSSSQLPFVAILYDNGLRFPVDDLHPGQVLVATHMKVCHIPDNVLSSFNVRTYVKATHFSELYTTHTPESPYVRYPEVTAVASIIRDHPNEVQYVQANVLRAGGVPVFLKGYKTLEDYKESFGHSLHGKMIPGAYWKTALDSLSHRERRCVTLGGFIIQVDYCDMQTVDSQQPVYGWSYASNIISRRTIFVNIKGRYRLGNLEILNPSQNAKGLFPTQYASRNEEVFKTHRQFPACEAANWTQPSDSEFEDLPVLSDGYYVITIASLHYQAILQCIFVPEPSAKPHPSLLEALTGDLQPLPCMPVGVFLNEPPRYTWDEVREINRTASEVFDKTFVFAIELHRLKSDLTMAHLKRAYICPPDQLPEAFADDIVQ